MCRYSKDAMRPDADAAAVARLPHLRPRARPVGHTTRTALALHADYTPCDWEHHQHATVLWLSRALLASMHWTVPTAGALQPAPADADLICVCSSSDLSRHSASESLVHHLLTRACGIEELCPAPGQRKDRRACHGSTAVRQHDNRQLQHNRPVRQHGRRNSISRTAVSAAGSGPLDPHAAPRNQ